MTATTYDLMEIPANEAGTRFALPVSPSGIQVTPAAAVALAWQHLNGERNKEMEPATPPFENIELAKIARTTEGDYVLVKGGSLRCQRTHTNRRPTRYAKVSRSPGAALDDLFLGGETFDKADDQTVMQLAVDLARELRPTGDELRRWNQALALLLLRRAGYDPDPLTLPV
jgi:hypothetical protein